MLKRIVFVLLVGIIACVCKSTVPPAPKICGSVNGAPVTGTRIKLRDGRYLAYKEHGVPKQNAKYKIVFVHGFGASRHDVYSTASPEVIEELGLYIVSFDRPGYGESDPDPNRTIKSTALDIEDLANNLGLGSKFYVLGFSMGGHAVWGCLNYIPHRLAGATLVAPVINYWWKGFPENMRKEAYNLQYRQDQWALRVAHYIPWLTYWWNTQKWFPGSSVASGIPQFSAQDFQILAKIRPQQSYKDYVTQQGVFESLYREMRVGFGKWAFDPMDLKNPFPNNEGSVHLWQGDDDGLVPITLQRFVAQKLPWIHYHEVPGAGHLFRYAPHHKDSIIKALVLA